MKGAAAMDVVVFGEILWDVIDGIPHLGGAPFNFAAHAARLGLKTAMVSAVGHDELGTKAIAAAKRFGVDVSFVERHPSLPTGIVNVTLSGGIPSYEIVRPVAWDEISGDSAADAASVPPKVFYFGTLAQRSPVSAATFRRLLGAFEPSLVFFDVNLRQDWWSKALVLECLEPVDILKVNDEEMKTLGFSPEALFSRFPRLKAVVETRGAEGCRVASREEAAFDSPAICDGPVVDTVGAGDSFSAAFIAAILRGENIKAAAEAGNCLAGKVAARAGAIPEDI